MRVNPGAANHSISIWHVLSVLGFLFLLVAAGVYCIPNRQLNSFVTASEKQIKVLVAATKIEAGQPLASASLVMERRPVRTLPSDAVSSPRSIEDKVAAGPIPAGFPISLSLLAEPVRAFDSKNFAKSEEPVETFLRLIEPDTAAVKIRYSPLPAKGTRVAVTLGDQHNSSQILADEAWVSAVETDDLTLRLDPAKALLIEAAKSSGPIGLVEIPADGPSPYAGKALVSLAVPGSFAPKDSEWSWVN